MEDPKKTIRTLLTGNITVKEDDGVTLIPVLVHDGWFEKSLFKDKGILVTVGPDIGTENRVAELGASRINHVSRMQIDVWVLVKIGKNYKAERVKWDVCREIERRLSFDKMVRPTADIDYLFLRRWRDRDEPGTPDVFRASCECEVHYMRSKS